MKPRRLLALLCAVAMLVVLACCGGQTAQDDETNKTEQTQKTDCKSNSKTEPANGKTGDNTTKNNSPTESANNPTPGGNESSGSDIDENNSSSNSGTATTDGNASSSGNSGSGASGSSSGNSGSGADSNAGSNDSGSSGAGSSATEPQPVHYHSYSDYTVDPTCESGGYTTHTCSCGDKYTDSYTSALGHNWEEICEEHEVEQTEMQCHTFCGACGADLTAMGLTVDQILDHTENHAINGESSRRYEEWIEVVIGTTTERTVVGYKCSRCGAIK